MGRRVLMRFADQRARFSRRVMKPPDTAAVRAGGDVGGKTFDVTDPRIVPTSEAAAMLRAPWRQTFGVMSTPSTLLLRRS